MRTDTSRFIQAALSAAGASVAAGLASEWRTRQVSAARRERDDSPKPIDRASRRLIRSTIQYFLVPLWTAVGLADWWCHRRNRIEVSAGVKESLMHLLMLGEAAVPVVLGLFFEINPLLLSVMIAAFFAHEATAMWDVDYAVTRRDVSPLEQHVHSFLELVPLAAVMLLTLLYWPQAKALCGLEIAPPSTIRLKREPLAPGYIVSALAAMAVFGVLPYAEELWRDLRTRRDDFGPGRQFRGPI
jgi:hypothetical protein